MPCRFQKGLILLIDDMLEVERLLGEIQGHSSAEKQLKAKYRYWLRLLEIAYDSFVWIAANHDRSEVTKYYKGPKHDALVHQNNHSVIELAKQLNREPDVFAFPLDFSRFACITDLLRTRRHRDGRVSQDFIEVKEGAVNDEAFELLKAKDPDRYFAFFDKYGEKGIAQIQRMLNLPTASARPSLGRRDKFRFSRDGPSATSLVRFPRYSHSAIISG
jgi:hypothetical protein